VVQIDEAKARRAGLSNQDIALSLQTALSGFETGDFREGEGRFFPLWGNPRVASHVSLACGGPFHEMLRFAQHEGRNRMREPAHTSDPKPTFIYTFWRFGTLALISRRIRDYYI